VNKGSVNLIDKNQLAYLASGKHSFELINEELRWLQEAVATIPNAKLTILNKTADFNETDTNTVFGALIVEGLHCFFDDPNALNAKEQFLANFSLFTDSHTVVAINLPYAAKSFLQSCTWYTILSTPLIFIQQERESRLGERDHSIDGQ
jgi:hypothetical protein